MLNAWFDLFIFNVVAFVAVGDVSNAIEDVGAAVAGDVLNNVSNPAGAVANDAGNNVANATVNGTNATVDNLTLHLFSAELAEQRGAKCLDHSPAGYYIRHGNPDRWVVFLQGGGLCFTSVDCIYRALKTKWGTSTFWKHNATPEDNHQLTAYSELNPFQNWTHVYVPYCSGDMWLGTSKKTRSSLLGLQLSGHRILDTVLDVLAQQTTFNRAKEVVFGGTSAGGIGVTHNLDWFAGRVAKIAEQHGAPPPKVVGISVQGMFLPIDAPIPYPLFVMGSRSPLDKLISRYLTNFIGDIFLEPSCVEAAKAKGTNEALCWSVSVAMNYVKTPMFFLSNMFDQLLIRDLGVCSKCTEDVAASSLPGGYIRYNGNKMLESMREFKDAKPNRGVFLTANLKHDQNYDEYFEDDERRVNGVSMREAIEKWYFEKESVYLIEDGCPGRMPLRKNCNESEHDQLDEVHV